MVSQENGGWPYGSPLGTKSHQDSPVRGTVGRLLSDTYGLKTPHTLAHTPTQLLLL